ncbi:MAG: hypothetical protein SGJ23_04755 [Alphaproteobacteria bacterium]|nr:hypothetical protein [Alphaproteobacteria bacterium]
MHVVRPLRHRRQAYAAAARELHLWLLQVLAWGATRVRLPRILRLDFQDEVRKARRDIRLLIFLGMCSRMTFRKDRPSFTRRPHGIAGYRRRRLRLLRTYTRGIALRTLRDMRDALKDFHETVKRAIARLPRNGVAPGAVVTVIAVTIALGASAPAPAPEAADTS